MPPPRPAFFPAAATPAASTCIPSSAASAACSSSSSNSSGGGGGRGRVRKRRMSFLMCITAVLAYSSTILSLSSRLVLYSNFIGVKWEKEALVPRVSRLVFQDKSESVLTSSSSSSPSTPEQSCLSLQLVYSQGTRILLGEGVK